MKIAVISSAEADFSLTILPILDSVVQFFIKHQLIILTGGCVGILGYLIKRLHSIIPTICYSPDKDNENHNKRLDNLSSSYFSTINYVSGFTLRSLKMIQDADAILALNGRIGTLSEITIALEEGKRIGIITATGGVSDHIEFILNVAQKEFPNQIFFSPNPEEVLYWLIKNHL